MQVGFQPVSIGFIIALAVFIIVLILMLPGIAQIPVLIGTPICFLALSRLV